MVQTRLLLTPTLKTFLLAAFLVGDLINAHCRIQEIDQWSCCLVGLGLNINIWTSIPKYIGEVFQQILQYIEAFIRDLGCDTLQYILPTRFIFRHTDQVCIELLIQSASYEWKLLYQVPEALGEVASHLSSNPRPLAVHCLSDTGVMTAQVAHNIFSFSVIIFSSGLESCPCFSRNPFQAGRDCLGLLPRAKVIVSHSDNCHFREYL